jgi:hypothetical protein
MNVSLKIFHFWKFEANLQFVQFEHEVEKIWIWLFAVPVHVDLFFFFAETFFECVSFVVVKGEKMMSNLSQLLNISQPKHTTQIEQKIKINKHSIHCQ